MNVNIEPDSNEEWRKWLCFLQKHAHTFSVDVYDNDSLQISKAREGATPVSLDGDDGAKWVAGALAIKESADFSDYERAFLTMMKAYFVRSQAVSLYSESAKRLFFAMTGKTSALLYGFMWGMGVQILSQPWLNLKIHNLQFFRKDGSLMLGTETHEDNMWISLTDEEVSLAKEAKLLPKE